MNEQIIFLFFTFFSLISLTGIYIFALKKIKESKNKNNSFLGQIEKHWEFIQENSENSIIQVFAVSSIFNWLEPYKTPINVTISGSGFFISEDGYILTNSNLVENSKLAWIQIPILNQKKINVDIISVCPERDLALLKINNQDLEQIKTLLNLNEISFLNLGNSDLIKKNDKVLVLGYPFGQHYLKSVTSLVNVRENSTQKILIQIDCAINQGVSGGPILNELGQVVGVSTINFPMTQFSGYFIPINEFKAIFEKMKSHKFVRKQNLGIKTQNSTIELVKYLSNPAQGGLFISKVYNNSIAQKMGIMQDDMIYEINGMAIDINGEIAIEQYAQKISFNEMISRLSGQKINLLLYRKGKKIELNFKLEDGPINSIRTMYPQYQNIDYEMIGGLVIMNLTKNHINSLLPIMPELIIYEKPENQIESALIISYIIPGSQIHKLKVFNTGQIIKSINNIEVKNLEQFRIAVKESLNNNAISIATQDSFIVLDLMNILKDESKLAQEYKYPLTDIASDLIAKLKIESEINR